MMVSKDFLYRIKKYFICLIVVFVCVYLLSSPESSSKSIKTGINYCINILVPSLFPFMFMAVFTVQSKIFSNPGKIISKITNFLFYLPGCTAPVILLSLIGGYPVGARGAKTLFDQKKINSEQLNRMMCFCVGSGPGFTISLVGTLILHSKLMGLVLLVSQIFGAFVIGIFCGVRARKKNFPVYTENIENDSSNINTAQTIIDSTSAVCASIIEMCTLIIIFTFFISIIENAYSHMPLFRYNSYFKNYEQEIITTAISFLEITTGCIKSANLKYSFLIIAAALGYGGVCTHMQISAILKNCKFNFKKFCFFRFINSIISLACAYIASEYFEFSSEVFSNLSKPLTASHSSTIHGSIALIMLSIYFIATVNFKFYKKNK